LRDSNSNNKLNDRPELF